MHNKQFCTFLISVDVFIRNSKKCLFNNLLHWDRNTCEKKLTSRVLFWYLILTICKQISDFCLILLKHICDILHSRWKNVKLPVGANRCDHCWGPWPSPLCYVKSQGLFLQRLQVAADCAIWTPRSCLTVSRTIQHRDSGVRAFRQMDWYDNAPANGKRKCFRFHFCMKIAECGGTFYGVRGSARKGFQKTI